MTKRNILMLILIAIFILPTRHVRAETVGTRLNITVNTTTTEVLSTKNEQDYFQFSLTDPGSLKISFNYNTSGEYKVTLYEIKDDSTVEEINSVNFSASTETDSGMITEDSKNIRVAAGNYYVMVQRKTYGDYSDESYDIKLNYTAENEESYETQPNNEADFADKLSLNSAITGNLDSSNDQDYFTFDLKKKGVVQFALKHAKSGDYILVLYRVLEDKSLSEVMTTYYYSSSGVSEFITEKSDRCRLPKGTYYIKLSKASVDYSNEDYNLTAMYSKEGDTCETEFNNSMEEANEITLNQAIKGNLTTSDDVDYYKITFSSAKTLKLILKHISSCQYKVSVYKVSSSGKLTSIGSYESDYSLKGTVTENLGNIKLKKGNYILTVESEWHYANNDYILKLKK